jgi:hypothetical protein
VSVLALALAAVLPAALRRRRGRRAATSG